MRLLALRPSVGILLLVVSSAMWADDLSTTKGQPEDVVRQLYREIVKRHPLGIPKGTNRTAIWPFLSSDLRNRLDTAQRCERDYFRQHKKKNEKPEFPWLEDGLFSGGNEEALPTSAVVKNAEQQHDGTIRVNVELSYKETPTTFAWRWKVAAIVKAEAGRYVVDEIVQFGEEPRQEIKTSAAFAKCRGARWVGYEKTNFSTKCTPDMFGIFNAPPTARQVSCFTSFEQSSTMMDVVRKCGIPDEDIGSGLMIFVYHLTDGSEVVIGTPSADQPHLRITNSFKGGKVIVLME